MVDVARFSCSGTGASGPRPATSAAPTALLLISRDPDLAARLERALGEPVCVGLVLTRAGGPAEAEDALAACHVDLVLLEAAAPNLVATVDRLRHASTAPIVALVRDDPDAPREVTRTGADDDLPADRLQGEFVARVVRHAIERRRLDTEIERLARDVAAKDEVLRNLVTCNADGMLILAPDGTILYANPAADTLLERRSGTLVRTMFGFPAMAGRRAELEVLHRDGRTVTTEVRVVDVEWQGRPALLASLRDVTERKQVEQERARVLEAEAAARARNDILSDVSHDLKNPLATVKARAQMLQLRARRIQSLEVDGIVAGLEQIDLATTRITALLDELMDAIHLELGHALDLDEAVVDLVALVRRVADDHRHLTTRHRIVVDADPPTLLARGDSTRLERVLANLLSNAVRYSPDGGEIVARLRRDDAGPSCAATIEVIDQGIGIPPEDLPHVFDRFRRAGNVAGRIGGRGIGLASARQIVEQHGGTIAVSSRPGRGSTFTVRLPLAP